MIDEGTKPESITAMRTLLAKLNLDVTNPVVVMDQVRDWPGHAYERLAEAYSTGSVLRQQASHGGGAVRPCYRPVLPLHHQR